MYPRLEQGSGVSAKIGVCPPSSLAWQQLQKIGRYVISRVCYLGVVLKR